MPTPQQRKDQFNAVRAALDICENARSASDLVAFKASGEADQLPQLQANYIRARAAFAAGTGTGAAVDDAQKAYFAVANVEGADISAAQAAYVIFTTDLQAVIAAALALSIDPGAVERV